MQLEERVAVWAVAWAITAFAIVYRHWRADRGVGLLFAYVLSFGLIHWIAPVMNLLPWFDRADLVLVEAGFAQSTYAMVAFAVGIEITWRFLARLDGPRRSDQGGAVDRRLVLLYLVGGIFVYAVIFPVAGRIPSVSALASAGSTLIVAAVGLKCWNAWHMQHRTSIWLWLLASATLPLITVVTQGFLGYGFAAMLTIFAFVASFYQPRWKVAILALALGYLGLSVYVTYMRDRADIRAVVWTGGSLPERVSRIYETFANIEWFDPYDVAHLARIDSRLNQDYLVGAAVAFLDSSPGSFARGETIREAALAIVPRILWPEKPVAAGSGDLVSIFTGFRFAEGTSVGIGQVMECYVNFGTPGVVVGFLLIGALIMLADRSARLALQRHDLHAFTYCFLPGLSLLQVGGSFVEVIGSAGGALVVAFLLRRAAPLLTGQQPSAWSPAAADSANAS